MARAVSVLYLALSIFATSVVAEVLTCPGGDKECFEKDDMESLLQHQHSVASGSDRTAILTDKEASGSNASSNRFEYQGWSRSAPNDLPNKDGFYDADTKPNNKKCFLSKNSVFTVPSSPDTDPWFSLPRFCQSSYSLGDVETLVVQRPGGPCVECRRKLHMMRPISAWVAECGECAEWWNRVCLTDLKSNRGTSGWDGKQFADQVFARGQQPFMIQLAKVLSNHGVSLYLDFADEDAERWVERFNGRTVKNWPDQLTFGMMELLAERARADGVEVVHWAGATKSFCEAEMAGALRGGKMPKVLHFPPLYHTESMTNMPAVCNTCPQSDRGCQSHLSIASQVCSLCGGSNCGNINVCSHGGGGAGPREAGRSQDRRDSGGGRGGGGGAGRLPSRVRSGVQGFRDRLGRIGGGGGGGGGGGAGRLPSRERSGSQGRRDSGASWNAVASWRLQ